MTLIYRDPERRVPISEIVDHIHKTFNLFSKSESKRIVRVTFDIIIELLKNGQEIYIPRFGKFLIKNNPSRKRFNVSTKQSYISEETKSIKFAPFPGFKKRATRARGYVEIPELQDKLFVKRMKRKSESEENTISDSDLN